MSEHTLKIVWNKQSEEFTFETYNRSHTWDFGNENIIEASSAPDFKGDPEMVDPEQAFVASVASCHMLTFLAIASKRRIPVECYEDHPVGILGTNEHGKMAMTKVTLHPKITFSGEPPTKETVEKLHEQAHNGCFIANSINTPVEVR